jgi:thiol-disulfide isomerase/thioredoxin
MEQPPAPPSPALLERTPVRAAVAAVLLAALFVAVFAVGRQRSHSGSNRPVADATAPALGPTDASSPILKQLAPDFTLQRSDGTIVKLSDLRGKVVWLNFWATWCVPCKQELPDIQTLYDEKHSAGLEVLEINYQEARADALAYFEARNLTMPLLLDSGSVFDQYKLKGLPDSFFIDRDGKLVAMNIGIMQLDRMRQRLADAGLP